MLSLDLSPNVHFVVKKLILKSFYQLNLISNIISHITFSFILETYYKALRNRIELYQMAYN